MVEAILNRLRGTGVIKHFCTLRVNEMKIWNITPKQRLGKLRSSIWTNARINILHCGVS